MSAPALERFLARLYADAAFAAAARRDVRACARSEGLSPDEVEEVARMDLDAAALAAESYACKREAAARAGRPGRLRRLWARLRRSASALRGRS